MRLLKVGLDQLIEADIARGRVVYIRRDGRGFGGRTEGASGEAGVTRRGKFGAGGFCDFGRNQVHFSGKALEVIISLCNAGGAEGVGFDDVRAGGKILFVNFANEGRLGQC